MLIIFAVQNNHVLNKTMKICGYSKAIVNCKNDVMEDIKEKNSTNIDNHRTNTHAGHGQTDRQNGRTRTVGALNSPIP